MGKSATSYQVRKRYNQAVLCVEFHCHTRYSKDSLTRPEALVASSRRKGIDRVIVTDHNCIAGALEARQLDADLVIVGEEIMTTRGELLAAFVQEEVPAGLAPAEAIRRLRGQGAFISVSHPFDLFRSGHWEVNDLLEILPQIDAIEIFNSRCMLPVYNHKARAFARRYHLPGTVGSDAHAALELGRAVLYLDEFSDADGLRACLRTGRQRVRWSPPWFHLLSRYAVWRKRREVASKP